MMSSDRGEGILMERSHHQCCSYPLFIHNFKVLFDKTDNDLYGNKNLKFTINDELES